MYRKMQESGLTEIIPLVCTLSIRGQCPVLFHPESTLGARMWVAAVAKGLASSSPFVPILSALRAHHQVALVA